jgi:hypothetical protein
MDKKNNNLKYIMAGAITALAFGSISTAHAQEANREIRYYYYQALPAQTQQPQFQQIQMQPQVVQTQERKYEATRQIVPVHQQVVVTETVVNPNYVVLKPGDRVMILPNDASSPKTRAQVKQELLDARKKGVVSVGESDYPSVWINETNSGLYGYNH